MTELQIVPARSGKEEPDAPLITTEFYVSGDDFDPEACTRRFQLEPTEIWRQERADLKRRTDLSNLSWVVRKSRRPLYSVDDAVSEILDIVWPAVTAIREFVDQNDVEVGVNCNVTIYEDRPVYELSKITIERLAEIGCEFGLDIFDYSEDSESE